MCYIRVCMDVIKERARLAPRRRVIIPPGFDGRRSRRRAHCPFKGMAPARCRRRRPLTTPPFANLGGGGTVRTFPPVPRSPKSLVKFVTIILRPSEPRSYPQGELDGDLSPSRLCKSESITGSGGGGHGQGRWC